MRAHWLAGFAIAAFSATAHSAAVTIYKHVDAHGRVTYTNQLPKDMAGYAVLEIEIDAPAPAPVAAAVVQTARPAREKRRVMPAAQPAPIGRTGGYQAISHRVAAGQPPLALRIDPRLSFPLGAMALR